MKAKVLDYQPDDFRRLIYSSKFGNNTGFIFFLEDRFTQYGWRNNARVILHGRSQGDGQIDFFSGDDYFDVDDFINIGYVFDESRYNVGSLSSPIDLYRKNELFATLSDTGEALNSSASTESLTIGNMAIKKLLIAKSIPNERQRMLIENWLND